MDAKIMIAAAAVAGLIGVGPAEAGHGSCSPRATVHVEVGGGYRTAARRVWIEPVYQYYTEQVWVPGHCGLNVQLHKPHFSFGLSLGRRCDGGHYETVTRRVLVQPGYWETIYEPVSVQPLHRGYGVLHRGHHGHGARQGLGFGQRKHGFGHSKQGLGHRKQGLGHRKYGAGRRW